MHIIYADGIGTGEDGFVEDLSILYKVVSRIQQKQPSFRHTRLKWPSSMVTIGGRYSWAEASRLGVRALNSIIDQYPETQFILLGYSGGCRVIHEWLEQNPARLGKIAAVGLLSDPYRPRDRKQYGSSETIGWGICGQKVGPIPDRTFWSTAPGDCISDAMPDAILRTPADVSDVMPGQFLWRLRDQHQRGNLQLAWQIGVVRHAPLTWLIHLGPRLHQARLDIKRYLNGRHTTAYITARGSNPSRAEQLADSIVLRLTRS